MNTFELQSSENPGTKHPEESLLIGDLLRYLSRLAVLNKEDKTGNLVLSDGLRQMARALRPHADLSIAEFADLVRTTSDRSRNSPRKEKATLPPNLESLSGPEIEKILDDDEFTKSQIAEVGTARFGISRSSLKRSSRQDALESIRAALDHEKSLEFISEEARRSGENRLL